MELLVFGHAGLPAIVFPTSQGRFFEFEDRGMVAALWGKIESGGLQLFCLDSVDSESWYNKNVPPRWRIARHAQYEDYLLHEVVPLIRQKNPRWDLGTVDRVPATYNTLAGNYLGVTRYVRGFQSRRSLLIWKIYGRRLDGWTNDDFPTEKVPGDASTLHWKGKPLPNTAENRETREVRSASTTSLTPTRT